MTAMRTPFAMTGKSPKAAPSPTDLPATNAQDAASQTMVLKAAIVLRQSRAITPYNPDTWWDHLAAASLVHRYPNIYDGLCFGFTTNLPPLIHTFIPVNSPTILEHHDMFLSMLSKEFTKKRYIGPYTHFEIEAALGPFQTAPLPSQ